MLLLADNDLILKLCAFNLFDEVTSALHVERNNIRRLPTATYTLRDMSRQAKHVAQYGKEGLDRATEVLQSLQALDNNINPILQGRLQAHQGIDKGEAVLVATAFENPDAFLATGDKRFIKAFCQARDLEDVQAALKGKIWCLEAVLLEIIKNCGFDTCDKLVAPVLRVVEVDKYIKMVWRVNEANVMDGLLSQVRVFNSEFPQMLVPIQ